MKFTRNLLLIILGIGLNTASVLAEDVNPPQTNSTTQKTITEGENTELNNPEEIAKKNQFIAADELYLAGDVVGAAKIYRQLKPPFTTELQHQTETIPSAIYDAAQLSPKASVYWHLSATGLEQKLPTKTLIALKFLIEESPQFIPGYLRYAEVLKKYERPEEALQILEKAAAIYSNEPDLLRVTIATLGEQEKWLEASLMARQFALLNTENPQAKEFQQLADKYLERYQKHLRGELTGNAITNLITGSLSYILTKNLYGAFSALDSTALLLQGESSIGEQLAEIIQKQAPLLEDEEVLSYVREIGDKLAHFAGRDQFNYQFYVIMDDQLNAFALPGGKVFINGGALLKTKSEAEFAGLLAHELSHAVLSHGFQLATEGNLMSSIFQFLPYGYHLANIVVLDYSRDMERQADILGTKILAASGYAADGLRNVTVTLSAQETTRNVAWLSSHPDTKERISYIENLIVTNGYNRYAYEGVSRHLKIQEKVNKLMAEFKAKEESEQKISE